MSGMLYSVGEQNIGTIFLGQKLFMDNLENDLMLLMKLELF